MNEPVKSSLGSLTYAGWVLQSGRHVHLDELTAVTMSPLNPQPTTKVYVKMAEKQLFDAIERRAQDMNQDHVPFVTFAERVAISWTRDILLEKLADGEVEVDFTNEMGEVVKMICTLKSDLIPLSKRPKPAHVATPAEVALSANQLAITSTVNTPDPNLFKVYATDRQGWRSFKLNRVLKVRV